MSFVNLLKSGIARYIVTDEPAFVMVGDTEDDVLVFEDRAGYDKESKSSSSWTGYDKESTSSSSWTGINKT
jgi:hypothetical protein